MAASDCVKPGVMNRCYVCRRPGPTILLRGRGVCSSCKTALPRVLELETNEVLLVKAVQDIRDNTKDAYTNRDAKAALSKVANPTTVGIEEIARVIARVVEVLTPSRAKGHALQLVETPEGHLAKFACIMPQCEVCAVVGTAEELLRLLTSP
jgi:hypothetical protein